MAACSEFRVIEIAEGFGAASLCGELMAGLGAEVVKIERAAGDPLRQIDPRAPDGVGYGFHLTNAGKKSAVLAADAATAERQWNNLVQWADAIVLDPKMPLPNVAIDSQLLSDRWPDKVICSISLFGEKGSRSSRVGNELIAEAMGGLMGCTGYSERPPVVSGVPYGEHVAALFGFGGIMAGLWERIRSGRGQYIDLSIVDCLIALLGNFMPGYLLSGRSPKRIGNRHTIAAPWNLYPTSDGQVVICTGTGGASWWKIICDLIGRPELGADDRYDKEVKRVQRVDEVDAIISEWTQLRTMAEVVEVMTQGGIPVSEIASVEAVLADPHYAKTRAMVNSARVETESGGKSLFIPGLPLKIGVWVPPAKAGPRLGEFRIENSNPPTSALLARREEIHAGGALDGIRILEFGSRTSVPMAGRLLSDLGADVVKIEPGKGESLRNAGQQIGGSSYLFHINNGGKRSVVIEPNTPRGRKLILDLAAKADVWLENLAPGALQAMGLGFEHLREVNPRIIYCSVSGFGLRSDYGKKKALDTVVQAASGVMYLTGYPDHFPVKLGISAVDLAAAVGLVGGVLSALHERRASGEGRQVDLAMADVGVWMTQSVWPQIFDGTGHPTRLGNRSAVACPHNTFPTEDGLLALAVDSDEQWRRLVSLVNRSELSDPVLATANGRLAHFENVERIIADWLAHKKTAEAVAACEALGVPAAPVRTLADIVEDPDVSERGLILEVDHPTAGKMRLLGNPLRLSRTPARILRHAPLLGEHTREVLTGWLDLNAQELDELESANLIVSHPANLDTPTTVGARNKESKIGNTLAYWKPTPVAARE